MPKISNVYRDKNNGKWYYVASLGYDNQGKRVRHWERGFSTQKEAKAAYDDYMGNYSKTAVKKNSTMTYREFYETYFEPDYRRSVRSSTFDNRTAMMRKHFFAYFGTRKLKDINAPMLKRWQNELSKDYSNAYIRLIYGMFQMSLDLAVKLGLLQRNVAKQVGNVKKGSQKVDFWTKEEFSKVASTFDLADYYERFSFTVVWTLFMTGIRIGEAQALLWSDIDFEGKRVAVNKSMYYRNAENFDVTPPKTKAGIRVIALDDRTVRYLQEWQDVQAHNIESKYILSYNGLPTNKHTVSHIIERHAKAAGVHRIKIHALRHSHASLLIQLGENALAVRDRLGHEDIETTLGTYGHLYPTANKGVADKLNGIEDWEV